MNTLQAKLSGYKTYLVALVSSVAGVVAVIRGLVASHSHLDVSGLEGLVFGGGLSALRAAVSKVETALKAKK